MTFLTDGLFCPSKSIRKCRFSMELPLKLITIIWTLVLVGLAIGDALAETAPLPVPTAGWTNYWQQVCFEKKNTNDCLDCCGSFLMKAEESQLCVARCGLAMLRRFEAPDSLKENGIVQSKLLVNGKPAVSESTQLCAYCPSQQYADVGACQTCFDGKKPAGDAGISDYTQCCTACCRSWSAEPLPTDTIQQTIQKQAEKANCIAGCNL